MAAGFFALLDDIGTLMDDVALATKVASQKTAGILGDDLAVNAEKSTGFVSSRELPVLWAISKGSLVNKIIIIPVIFLLNIYLPIAITIILMVGGAYLAFEGVEKIMAYFFHIKLHEHQEENLETTTSSLEDSEAEKKKVKDAIRTDFILSLEIVIIALSTVLQQPLWVRIVTVAIVALLATVGVYGIVALIVRMDDMGLKLIEKSGGKGILGKIGNLLVKALPVIVKILSIVGTIALLTVAGGLFLHNEKYLHHLLESFPSFLASISIGIAFGLVVFLVVWLIGKMVKH